ncbi:MAG: hypothetical protein QM736_09960 [Vicinamibacterales bacterium]
MTVVVSEVSPFDCRWITWKGNLPVCMWFPPDRPHPVSESECRLCAHWEEPVTPPQVVDGRAMPHSPSVQDPLNKETCPRCNSHDIVLMARDAVVQSFVCSICHQRRPRDAPMAAAADTRSKPPEPR